ncbi:OmpA family protein [Maribacter luteus]|uniref:OmpA family protein n=1 Tax=Maribacter luteus TaxID=2594478 RepID=UPI002491D5CA|nr:OmpA family protein [Maribacter luteus]
MKFQIQNISILLLLFFSYGLIAQISPTKEITQVDSTYPIENTVENQDYSSSGNLDQAKAPTGIPIRELTNLDIEDGFYIISASAETGNYANQTATKYIKEGFDSGVIHNTQEHMYYVHMGRYTNGQSALDAGNTYLKGHNKDSIWILNSSSSKKTHDTEPLALEEVTYDMLDSSKIIDAANDNNPVNKTKLIQKADSYFDKMWYAEAAELYEKALSKDEKNYSFDVIQKVGDAHYFNTDMEKAYHWYNILYEKYGKQMSADNIFKYAHSLKGTGKYARSKRLMRLYNRKIKDPNASITDALSKKALPNEVKLDQLTNKIQNIDIHNLTINSKYSEFGPMYYNEDQIVYASANDTSIFATRKYKWNDQPYLDLYAAKLNDESQELKNAVKFSKEVNTKYHEASVTFSPDNETMYFTRNNYGKKLKRDKKGINHLKIYRSKKVNGEWTEATEVPFNSDSYSTGHPALSPDGKKLYFVSDMPGSIGQTDIFVVDVLEDGNFSEPRNLGPEINTERKEMFPFVNNEKIYFSSDGHVGLGGLDIFEATIAEDGGFLEARNLGQPINSNKDDFSFIVNEEDQKGFFASNRKGGQGDDDLYSFRRPIIEEVPESINAIAGVITDLVTGERMPKTMITLLDENNIKMKEMVTDDQGSFIFEDLEGDTKYTIKTTVSDFFDEEIAVSTKDNEVINTEIALRRLKEMIAVEDGIRKLKTEMIYFDFDKSYIRKDAAKELDKLVQVMTEYPKMVIKIESHTDSRGKRAYNKYLSDKRAKSTRDYIISKGIDADRIESAIGYGEERLINECDGTVPCSEANHLLNRRSEFIIVDM